MHKKALLILFFLLWASPALAEWTVDTAWVRTYNGPGNGSDWAEAIAVDGSGNVYVTGYSYGSGTQFDYASIKYLPNGDVAPDFWPTRYNGPGNSYDWAQAIAVDGSGNVYVTGASSGSGTGDDYATIRYLPSGRIPRPWPIRYNGPGNGDDWASAIAVDSSGNVYVTGASVGNGTSYDYATIKYYPLGTTAWVSRYDGPVNGDDRASAIAIDYSGHVYVTGASVGSGTSYDYVTIKYNPDGDTAWVRRFNGTGNDSDYAYAIAVDDFGNVYVTGWSIAGGTSHDYLTIKYLPNGVIAEGWPKRYDGPGHGSDKAYAIAVDGFGYVSVTGESQWDYATIRYEPDGDTAWVRRYNGPANHVDVSRAIALDDSGNVYVTGVSAKTYEWPIGNLDYATIKYYPNGDTDWLRRYNGPADNWDNAFAIAVDDSGNVYVTGYSYGQGTDLDYATIKYVNLEFLRGDANGDGLINVCDVVYLTNYLYRGGPMPYPWEAGDANCDGEINDEDVDYLVDYLFRSGPPPGC